ncbi:hypothetical protein SO694_00043014 [Aureococcus anophagefferens]|uniref:PAS domain-containing protein n=1 Tax=Aureococcus anophagefferens TaxID=44056 RepID=A0ABR1G6Y7_AURAN
MVYVNPEFCRVTEYPREEAVGRNCRFLQGPDTEPESIQVIQETLCKGEDCHVLLTNYRKSGDKFKNLLSMRPVYDADDVYRYTIGVQFEVEKDNSPAKLQQLNKLLQMLPKKLNLRSAKVARDRGLLAARTDGGANDALTAPTEVETHVQFAREAADVLRDDLESKASKKQLRKLHLRMRHNPIFYCTRTEIVIGDIDETAWEPIRKEVAWGLDELESAETHLHTCAHGVSTETSDERYWLDMFSGVASSLEDVGVVVSDMRVPGIPLVAINEPGFRNQTGYGPEQIGKKCTFLQGPETEQYLIDEIADALRECKGLAVKLTNVKKDGSAFQCYLALHPVFGANGEYLYQQDRTKATSTLWDGAKKGSVKSKTDAYVAVQKEAQNTFKMLVVDSFPRFVQSSYAKSLGASLAGPDLAKVRDADEWLSAFTQIAETWPACIVVSDMTIPGAPMVT